jgi:membrane-associated phospholipid phosphatase
MIDPLYIIDLIGYYGPQILFASSIFLLYKKSNYLFVYIIGFILDTFLNFLIKGIVKQPRPKGDYNIFKPLQHHGLRFSSDIYGMPSGHSQHVFYSTIFIYLVLKNTNITFIYILISILTLIQRVKYQNHFIKQVIVGGLIGACLAYYMYMYADKKIVGKLLPKKEDNAKDIA